MDTRRAPWLPAVLLVLGAFTLSLWADQDLTRTGKKEQITLSTQVRVGDAVLKAGEYQIQHVAGPDSHFIVFTEMVGSHGVAPRPGKEVARVKCTAAPADRKAERTELSLSVGPSGETMLKKISIKGEKGAHLF